MKKIISILIICILLLTGCTNNSKTNNDKSKESDIKMSNIKVTINDKAYNLKLENNNTVEEFINLLPQEYNMNDLNNNEKYVYIDKSLSTNSYNPKHIEKGDVMLFGNNCLVI